MDATQAIDLTRRALMLALILGLPVLLAGLAVALAVSILQAMTQVQDLTISFVPRIAVMILAVVLAGPWIFARLVEFAKEMFSLGP